MADKTKLTDVPAESAATMAGIDEARHMETVRRMNDLEYSLTKTRDALRVIARGLEDIAEEHASADALLFTQDDISMLYGTVNLLDCVAADCDRAMTGEA